MGVTTMLGGLDDGASSVAPFSRRPKVRRGRRRDGPDRDVPVARSIQAHSIQSNVWPADMMTYDEMW